MATKKKATRKKAATHRAAADEHAATELVMYIENTSDLSLDGPHGQGHSVLLNALRKWRKGTYDPALAVRLFEYLTESGAKRYAKEMGSSEKEWSTMFNPATRHEAAKQLEESFRSSAENGEYDYVDTRIGVSEGGRGTTHEGTVDQNLVPFHSWSELMTYARAHGPLFYKAPMDHRATRLTPGHGTPNSYEVRARTIRIWPPGSVGRGRSRTADPFTADAGHLSRFFMPTDEVGGSVYETRESGNEDRLFVGIYPTGIVWADRTREKHGDYARCAFLDFSTLTLEFERDCPADLHERIKEEAAIIQAKRGERFDIDASGHSITLGGRPGARESRITRDVLRGDRRR